MGNTNNHKVKLCKRCDRQIEKDRLNKANDGYCGMRDCYNKAGYSKKAIEWLDSISKKIQHAERGGEKEIQVTTMLRNGRDKTYTFKVDGYNKKTNTVYEFYGDYFHGNPLKYNQNDIGPGGKTFGELYKKTIWRENLLKQHYNVVTIWEYEYMASRGRKS